ncbi:hypothetical protein PG996_013403 [Apiospora saccharicola]|uniref:Uncharacterized protein n=1 Tax=Apiospora saccharicola TaxID=335842 RepID=A0ABR1U5F0_9PEZI
MFFTTRGLVAAASAASLAMASPLSPAIVQRHLVGGDGVDAQADLLKDGKVIDARVDIDLTLLDEPLVVVAGADVAATIPGVVDLDTEVDLGLTVICNDCGVHGSVDLTVGVDKPLPYLEVSIKDFHTKLDLEVDLYAGAYVALELFKPDQVIELNLPGLLDVKAMVYLDLILSAELPISASLGAEVSLGKELKITTNLFEEAPIQADVDGTIVKLLPITVNVGCAKVEAFLRLRVAAIVGLDLKLNELLPILPDVGAGVALAVVADVVNVKLDLCDTPSCPVSSESWGIDVGVALDLDVALNDVSLVSLDVPIMLQILEIPTKSNCEHGPRPTGGNGNGIGGGNGGDNNGSPSAPASATATATRGGPGNGSGSGSGNGSDNGASPSATASGPGNGAGVGNGGDAYSNSPKPTGANGNGNGNNNGGSGNGNGNGGSGSGNNGNGSGNNGGNGSGNGNNGGSGSPSAPISATKATDAVTNGPQQTYTFVEGDKTTVTVTGPAEVPKHPQPTEATTGYAAQPKPTGSYPAKQQARDYGTAPQPQQPVQPEQPAQPTGSYPSQPKQPEQPAQPEQPKETVSSQSPPAPSTPAQPEQPGYPTQPEQPKQPEQPAQGVSSSSPPKPTTAQPQQPTGAYPAQPQQPAKETVSSQSPPAPSSPAQPQQPGYPAQPISNSTVPGTAATGAVSSTMSKPVAPYPVSTPAGATATYPAGAAQPTTMKSAPSPSGGYPVQTPVVTAGAAKVGSGFLAIAAAAVAFL